MNRRHIGARLALAAFVPIFAIVVTDHRPAQMPSLAVGERHIELDLSAFGARAHFSTSFVRGVADHAKFERN
ncbi:hypothetical protein [Stakelama marina]|uniref:Uncharacterized protein n=1 Tax=Stakelama marina TaxID=2826939 RepID=A0A8T4IEK3_9SPHN|nr:hypothetical protein [Stakelama marina]MBR0553438.1 hypothetical protein [Stakelama marina]